MNGFISLDTMSLNKKILNRAWTALFEHPDISLPPAKRSSIHAAILFQNSNRVLASEHNNSCRSCGLGSRCMPSMHAECNAVMRGLGHKSKRLFKGTVSQPCV